MPNNRRTSRSAEIGSLPLLGRRALNRATLSRQLLLERSTMPVVDAVEHLAGIQAQTTTTWYYGVWSRLADFRPAQVSDMLLDRRLVRIALMRSTIHMVSARDCLRLRPLIEPVLERSLRGNFGRHLNGVDREAVTAAARELLEEKPRTANELGKLLNKRWPERDGFSLAMAARTWLPLVQVPPRGVWGASGPAAHTTAHSWLGNSAEGSDGVAYTLDDLVLRYLTAFGPATVRDVQLWSGLTRLNEVVDRLRPKLVNFRDNEGRELFDHPDAPRPDADVPAPPRFLYEFDNLLLSHADRSRFLTEEYRQRNCQRTLQPPCIILLDGFTAGTWRVTIRRDTAVLTIEPFIELSGEVEGALADEGARLLRFAAGEQAAPKVEFVRPR
jgi:hypothetical protein